MEPLSANDPRMIGEFRLHAQLGAGGMGQVYLGFSPAGHAVAIKVIHAQFARDQEFLRRFSHEVAAASAVGGMYTAPVVDYDLNSGTPWLATAYVPGPTLATVISRHGALPEAALWRLAAGLAEALRAVHAKGLIHRDLKPANVLLADSGPHVIDFGISRASSSMTQLTSAGMAIGTPGYMSPEQAQVHPVGPPSDLFSLGCVLAYSATGTPPFNGDNPASILYRIVATEPDLSLVTPGFRQVIQACLKKNPAERPAPGQLIAMISQLGPATPVTLGSFWPDAVTRIIATEQATQTPAGLTPPSPISGPLPAGSAPPPLRGATGAAGPGGMPGATGVPWPAYQERPPTAMASPGQAANATDHAPMIADGYYAAAQRPAGPAMPSAPVPPQSYAPQQPTGLPLSGPVPPAQAPFGAPFGQAFFGSNPYGQGPSGPGAPYAGATPPYPGQSPAYPGQQPYQPPPQPYPGQQPGGIGPMGQYPVGRRRPMASEVPPVVRNAIRFMYAGCAAMALSEVVNFLRYLNTLSADNAGGSISQSSTAGAAIAGILVIGLIVDLIGLGCWIWLAVATRRGQGWTRTVATVLLGLYSLSVLFTLANNRGDAPAVVTAILVWALGLASIICLWSQQARDFFFAWRKR